jgi:hypothetical protein
MPAQLTGLEAQRWSASSGSAPGAAGWDVAAEDEVSQQLTSDLAPHRVRKPALAPQTPPSLTPENATAHDLGHLLRDHWGTIENKLH